MMNVRIFKATNHLHDRVHFANVMEKLVSQSFARACAFDQAGDIDELDRGWRDFFGVGNLCDFFQPRIGHRDDSDVRINRAERIIFCWRFVSAGDRVEKRRFPDVRQSDDSSAEHEVRTLPRAQKNRNFQLTCCPLKIVGFQGVQPHWAHRPEVCVPWQSRISGRRDLNPRPVAATTVLQIQLGKFVPASPRLEIQLPSHGLGSSGEAFLLHEKPWDPVTCGLGMTGIMPMYSIVKVLT